MRVAGGLMLLGSAGCGVWLALQNSDIVIHARLGNSVWTGHLYMVLVFGGLLAAWFLLGIAFLTARRRSARRRAHRSTRRAPTAAAQQWQYAPTSQYLHGDPSLHVQPGVRARSR
jgi:hypothetical protein